MFHQFSHSSFTEVCAALKPLASIKRPYGDNEHLPINHAAIKDKLSGNEREAVEHVEALIFNYVRNADGGPNRRAINTLARNGFPASLNPGQYDHSRFFGTISVGDWYLNVSDPRNDQDEGDVMYD